MKRFLHNQVPRFFKSSVPELPLYTKPIVEVRTSLQSNPQGQYKVTPSHPVPDHIPRPGYVDGTEPYGLYEGPPVIHSNETIESIIFLQQMR